MVILHEPERSVHVVREHRKHAKAPFAGTHGLNVNTTYASPWVSIIDALMASAGDLPPHSTNWNTG